VLSESGGLFLNNSLSNHIGRAPQRPLLFVGPYEYLKGIKSKTKGGENMAIAEACQVWIEQRIEEELEAMPSTGKSLRAIGKQLASEVEKIFQVKINSDTLRMRAMRFAAKNPQGGTNVHTQPTPQEHTEFGEKPEGLVIIRDEKGHFAEGTKVAGPGRRPKNQSEKVTEKEDSDALFQLKRWWKKATKKDRRQFILWTKGEAKDRGYSY
jgi:hypothetical protein